MTTKGTSVGFQVSSVDNAFVVPVFRDLNLRGTVLVYPRQFRCFSCPVPQPILMIYTVLSTPLASNSRYAILQPTKEACPRLSYPIQSA